MSIFKYQRFNAHLEYFESGFSLWGKPMVSVYMYLLDGMLIDTGQKKMRRNIFYALKEKKIEKILLSHHHEDHSGNAAFLSAQLQIPVYTGEETREILRQGFSIKPYQKYIFGSVAPFAGAQLFGQKIESEHLSLIPLLTPGHSPDHYAFLEKNKGWLFSGDLYIGKLKYMRQDEDIYQMIHSLRRILKEDFEELFCAHNPRFKNGKKHMQEKADYLEEFFSRVKQLQPSHPDIPSLRKALGRKNDWFTKIWTTGDVSVDYMIRSVMQSPALE